MSVQLWYPMIGPGILAVAAVLTIVATLRRNRSVDRWHRDWVERVEQIKRGGPKLAEMMAFAERLRQAAADSACMCEAYNADTGERSWRPCPQALCERADHQHSPDAVR